MKLVPKLTLALVAGTLAVLVANGFLRVEREAAVVHADRVRDHALLGRALGAAVAAVWRSDGRADAIRFVENAQTRDGRIRVHWVDEAAASSDARIDAAAISALEPEGSVTRITRTNGGEQRFTYSPVFVRGARVGLVELSEPLDAERQAVHGIVVDTVAMTLMLGLVSAGLAVILGFWLVGRPVRVLTAKARRIGSGDFAGPLELAQKDEFGLLASEMNGMCDRLVEAHERIERETSARIATLEQLRHADRLMTVGKLASGIAHELGTPLNVVSARASMIAKGETTPAETTEYARIIADASNWMAKIIRELLAFARRKPAEKTQHDLRRLAKSTLDLLRPLAEKKNIRLELRGDAPEVAARVDGGGIQQVITNLVVNGVQAMSRAGTIEVSVGHEAAAKPGGGPESQHLCIRIRDGGDGIAPENVARIFEPFFTTKDVGQGTGLGLSVTLGIVEDHGGWIEVRSEAKKGTVFAVYLPVGDVS